MAEVEESPESDRSEEEVEEEEREKSCLATSLLLVRLDRVRAAELVGCCCLLADLRRAARAAALPGVPKFFCRVLRGRGRDGTAFSEREGEGSGELAAR